LLISFESDRLGLLSRLHNSPSLLGALSPLYAYMESRHQVGLRAPVPDLPVPEDFKQVFRDWAEGKVSFTAPPSPRG
jgi:hypothetical protein